MKKLLLLSSALVGLSTSSFAADLPGRVAAPAPAPAYVAPIFTWTGFYVGAQVGYQWDRSNYVAVIPPAAPGIVGRATGNGGVFGTHGGYNWQMGTLVFGVEEDFEGADVKASGLSTVPNFVNGTSRLVWQGSLRGRLGFAFDRALIYATGGGAVARFDNQLQAIITPFPAGGFSETRFGWTVGGGLEYAFTPNLSGRVEYRYADYGKDTAVAGPWLTGVQTSFDHRSQTVRAGLTYHLGNSFFGGSAPVLAKY